MGLHFHATFPRFPTAVAAGYGLVPFVAGDLESEIGSSFVGGQSHSGYSLGGFRANQPLDRHDLPLFLWRSWEARGLLDSSSTADDSFQATRLFEDLADAERAAGKTDYRALAIWSDPTTVNLTNVTVGFSQPSVGTMSLWQPTPDPTDGGIQVIADELTAPTGAVWTQPTWAAPASLGALAPGATTFLWLRRVLAAGATATPYDAAVLRAIGTGTGTPSYTLALFWTTGNLANRMTVVPADGGVATACSLGGRDYTVSVFQSDGLTAADPPGNVIWVAVTAPGRNPPRWLPKPVRNAEELSRAWKVSAGVYRWRFRPSIPGLHHVLVDAGGMARSAFAVEVGATA